jgi:hypothetical protein
MLNLTLEFIHRGVMLLFGFLSFVKQLCGTPDLFPLPVCDHCRMNFKSDGKLGCALLVSQATRAIIALNSGLYCFRFLIIRSSFQVMNQSLPHSPDFRGQRTFESEMDTPSYFNYSSELNFSNAI